MREYHPQSDSSSPSTDSKWKQMKKALLPAPISSPSTTGTATAEDSSRSLPSSPSRNASTFFYEDLAKSETPFSVFLSMTKNFDLHFQTRLCTTWI